MTTRNVVTDTTLLYVKRWGCHDFTDTLGPGEQQQAVSCFGLLETVSPFHLKVSGGCLAEMDQAEKDAVDPSRVPQAKLDKYGEIDVRTDELIAAGFEYPADSGHRFSLSEEGQLNLLGVYNAKDSPAMTYPIIWPTIEDDYDLSVTDAAMVESFYLTALGTVRAVRDSGTVLKDQVRSLTTLPAVESFVDPR